jgi:hypothetical protein
LLEAVHAVQSGERMLRSLEDNDAAGSRESNLGPSGDPSGKKPRDFENDLFARARQEDARHWTEYHRPISAETLRRTLHIDAARSRLLVAEIRSTEPNRSGTTRVDEELYG